MTPLRQHMIAALQRSGKEERTQHASVRAVRLLAQCYGTSPDLLAEQELQHSFLHRKNVAGLAPIMKSFPPSSSSFVNSQQQVARRLLSCAHERSTSFNTLFFETVAAVY